MGTIILVLRDAVRDLRRDRGFAAAVILTCAVTIGATVPHTRRRQSVS